ncbi:MAG: hypothetical protein R8K20_11965 [Gallionellaceae bacterium]
MNIRLAEEDRMIVLKGVLQDLHSARAEINRLEAIVRQEITEQFPEDIE